MNKERIIALLIEELERAEDLHPHWPLDMFKANSILQEEAGEVTKAINEYVWGNKSSAEIIKEVVQTAAMCVRFLKSWGYYDTGR